MGRWLRHGGDLPGQSAFPNGQVTGLQPANRDSHIFMLNRHDLGVSIGMSVTINWGTSSGALIP